jgi:hypothetical protein
MAGFGNGNRQDVDTANPRSQLVFRFPGVYCGVPTIVGHFFIQSVPAFRGLIVLDIANADAPKEVTRLKLSDAMVPHWPDGMQSPDLISPIKPGLMAGKEPASLTVVYSSQ